MQQSRSLIGWVDPRLEGLQRPADPGRTPGLCRAISHHTGFDLTLVRALFILLTLSTGVGVLLYAWGTVLSHGADGRRPIDSLLPSFTQWSVKTQAIIVASSAFLFMVSFGQMAPLPLAVAVVVLILLYATTSRARRSPMPPPTSPRAAETDPLTAAERARSIDEWRAAMQQALRQPIRPVASREPEDLPVLDLYGPQPEPEPPTPKPKSSWVVGSTILLAGVVTFLIGTGGAAWTSSAFVLGVTAAVMGGLTFLSALALRGRQIPRLVLGIVAATALASAVLPMIDNGYYDAPAEAAPEATTMVDEELADIRETITVGSGGKNVVELSDKTPPVGQRVTYEVYASDTDLTVRIPAGQIEGVSLNGDYVELPPANVDGETIPMFVEVYGDNVNLTVSYPESIVLPSGVSLERDLTTYDLSDYSATNPLVVNVTGGFSSGITLTVPKGETWVTQDGSDLLGEEGKMPLVVNVTGEDVAVTLKEV